MKQIGTNTDLMNRADFFRPILPMIESIEHFNDAEMVNDYTTGIRHMHHEPKYCVRMTFNLAPNLQLDHKLLREYFNFPDLKASRPLFENEPLQRKLVGDFKDYELGKYVYDLWRKYRSGCSDDTFTIHMPQCSKTEVAANLIGNTKRLD